VFSVLAAARVSPVFGGCISCHALVLGRYFQLRFESSFLVSVSCAHRSVWTQAIFSDSRELVAGPISFSTECSPSWARLLLSVFSSSSAQDFVFLLLLSPPVHGRSDRLPEFAALHWNFPGTRVLRVALTSSQAAPPFWCFKSSSGRTAPGLHLISRSSCS
jgi:hypothetical protein